MSMPNYFKVVQIPCEKEAQFSSWHFLSVPLNRKSQSQSYSNAEKQDFFSQFLMAPKVDDKQKERIPGQIIF